MDTSLVLLQQYAALRDSERDDFPFQNPILLRKDMLTALSQQLNTLPTSLQQELRLALQELQTLLDCLDDGSKNYIIGIGPLENILIQYERGEIEIEYAEQLARSPEVVNNLAPVYARHLSRFAHSLMRGGAEWRRALTLQRLLLAANATLPPGKDSLPVRQVISLDWVEIVGSYLRRIPDGRLLRWAIRVGEQMLSEAHAQSDSDFLGKMYHRLGAIHLDPYTAGRDNLNFETQTEVWQRGLEMEYGEGLPGFSEQERKEIAMPELQDALETAERYFRLSIPYQLGSGRGQSLKALLQTLAWKEVVGLPVDQTEFIRIGQEAIDLLGYAQTASQRLEVLGMLERAGVHPSPEEAKQFFSIFTPEYIQRLPAEEVVNILIQGSHVFTDQSPFACLALLVNAREWFDTFADENYRLLRLHKMLEIIELHLSPELPPVNTAQDIVDVAQILDRADLEDVVISAGFIQLAGQATRIDRGDIALNLLQTAVEKAPDFWRKLYDVARFHEGMLTTGLAVNALNRGELPQTVDFYFRSIHCYADLGFGGNVNDLLFRVDDVISRAGTNNDLAIQVILGIGKLALQLETAFGQSAIDRIQDLLKRALMLTPQAANPQAVNFLFQIAKGLRFSAVLTHRTPFDVASDGLASDLLRQIAQIESSMDRTASLQIDEEAILNQNLLLASYIQGGEQQSGDTVQERLANLQQSFDTYVNNQLLAGAAMEQPKFWSVEEVQSKLDERSVLLNFYLGSNAAGRLTIWVYLFTRQDITIHGTVHQFPSSRLYITGGDRRLYMTPFGMDIGSLRDKLISEPGPWPVNREAARKLMEDMRGYLGGMDALFDKLRRAGKDHLIIVPHGPLHFYPFHLLGGEPGKLLAEQWKVSYLPSLSLLEKRQVENRPQVAKPMTAIGLRFEEDNLFGLAPLPESEQEARTVAAIFQTEPILDKQATKKAVFEALQSSRYIHISTHGQHNIDAAFFQCIYLSPDEDSDSRLYAYELLPLDLRGLELVTLSACETALGRFDNADNLRGLPAALLMVGVQSIIGTLWPVASQPAQLFFSILYGELKKQTRLLDAFYTAQTVTRKGFPQFRDWGPFYLIGQAD